MSFKELNNTGVHLEEKKEPFSVIHPLVRLGVEKAREGVMFSIIRQK